MPKMGTRRMASSHAIAAVGFRFRGMTMIAVTSIASTTSRPNSHRRFGSMSPLGFDDDVSPGARSVWQRRVGGGK